MRARDDPAAVTRTVSPGRDQARDQARAEVGDDAADEAGTDEVTALASMIQRGPHIPAPREDDEDELVDRRDDDVVDDHEHVLPRQRDEFTCSRCFLVVHVSRREGEVCRDCS